MACSTPKSAGQYEPSADSRNAEATASDDVFDPARFAEPARAYGPGLRWLWPGGAVDEATLNQQVELFAQSGYGMVEVQPVIFGLSKESLETDPRIRTVGEPSFFEHVRTVARMARAKGMAYDLTLGSGWPNGGVGVPENASEQQILWSRVDVIGPASVDMELPPATEPNWVAQANAIVPITAGFDVATELEAVVAAEVLDAAATPPVLGTPIDLTSRSSQGHLRWDAPLGTHAVFAFYRNSTRHVVAAAAFPGGPALAIDHLAKAGSRWVIEHQVTPWLDALGNDAPSHLFVDSFELVGELPWSQGLSDRYRERTGRAPYVDMPFFLREGGESKYVDVLREKALPAFASASASAERGQRAREDYEAVRAEAFAEEYLDPIVAALHARGVNLRAQAHGGPGVLLDDYARADVAESESLFAGGRYDFLALASSAAHVAGRRKVSLESFVTMNIAGPESLDEASLWQLSGIAYTAGINRPVHCVGVYPYPDPNGQEWRPFLPNPNAAFTSPAPFTAQIEPDEARWSFLPHFNRTQTRINYALSRGTPRVDIAWLMTDYGPRDDLVLSFGPLRIRGPESAASLALRGAGYTYDRISPTALENARTEGSALRVGAQRYRALIVDQASVIEPALLATMETLAREHVPIVWAGAPPKRAPGGADAAVRDIQVHELWTRLRSSIFPVYNVTAAPAALRTLAIAPEVEAPSLLGPIGIQQREVENGRVIWLFNESPFPQVVVATLRIDAEQALWLDPETGSSTTLTPDPVSDGSQVALALNAMRGGILFLARE